MGGEIILHASTRVGKQNFVDKRDRRDRAFDVEQESANAGAVEHQGQFAASVSLPLPFGRGMGVRVYFATPSPLCPLSQRERGKILFNPGAWLRQSTAAQHSYQPRCPCRAES